MLSSGSDFKSLTYKYKPHCWEVYFQTDKLAQVNRMLFTQKWWGEIFLQKSETEVFRIPQVNSSMEFWEVTASEFIHLFVLSPNHLTNHLEYKLK